MASTSPRSLSTAGSALIAAGFIAAGIGGLYGIANFAPGMVVLSVLLVIGYSVTGYLLLGRRDSTYKPAMMLSVVLVLATLWFFRPEVARFLEPEFSYFILFPALAYLLAFAAAHLAAYGFARRNHRVLWPGKGTEAVQPLLTACAAAPVLAAFLLLYPSRALPYDGTATTFTVGGAVLAASATAWGGVISSIRRHPRFTLFGASAGFLASVIFLYEFASRGYSEVSYLGQLYALAGMLLAGFPLAMSVVAWVELEGLKKDNQQETKPPKREKQGAHGPVAPPAKNPPGSP